MSHRWPEDKENELIRLWPTGLSCLLIGERIGQSRESVASKARNLNLPSRRKAQRALARLVYKKPRALANHKKKKCLKCRKEFTPKSVYIFRCVDCLDNARLIAPMAEGISA